MKNLKKENGAITIIVLVSVLFMVSFLISSYILISNKVKAQKDMIAETRRIYENYNIEEIYNSYFGKNIIHISDKEQLFAIGTGVDKIIDGNYYNFANDENTIYLLNNDIEFNAYDEESLMNEDGNYYWIPIGERTDLKAKFEGNDKKISVKYKDQENTEYTVVYSKEENYKEPEYKIKISPRIMAEDGEIISDARILVTYKNNGEFQEVGQGQIEVSVKRLVPVQVKAVSDSYRNSGIETIYIENPNKIKDYNLVLGKYSFTIVPTPSNAIVTINGEKETTISANKGEKISWQVELSGYATKSGTYIVQDDNTINVSLDKEKYTFTITPTPSNATVIINEVQRTSITVEHGTTVSYSVSCNGYHSQSGSVIVTQNSTIPISLKEIVYVPFSETFFVTSCTNNNYSGLLNNGSTTVSHGISWDATEVDMGLFEFNPEEISNKIPLDATISKITVYYRYRQSRSVTSLYINRVKVIIYAGLVEKLPEYTTSPVGNTFIDGSNYVTNVNRAELANGIKVHFTNYYKGNLGITSYLENVYCVIEGTYPT